MSATTTVFIVDSDPSVQRAMARLMKAANFQTCCANSIEELLEMNLPAHDAVIIADVNTARLFGETFPHQLHGKDRSLPVIYLTDYDSERMRNDARRTGAAGFFRKPVDEQALLDTISFCVQHAEAGHVT